MNTTGYCRTHATLLAGYHYHFFRWVMVMSDDDDDGVSQVFNTTPRHDMDLSLGSPFLLLLCCWYHFLCATISALCFKLKFLEIVINFQFWSRKAKGRDYRLVLNASHRIYLVGWMVVSVCMYHAATMRVGIYNFSNNFKASQLNEDETRLINSWVWCEVSFLHPLLACHLLPFQLFGSYIHSSSISAAFKY